MKKKNINKQIKIDNSRNRATAACVGPQNLDKMQDIKMNDYYMKLIQIVKE